MACFQLGEGVNSRCILALAAPAWYLGRESRLGGEEERRSGLLRADVSFLGIWHIFLTVLIDLYLFPNSYSKLGTNVARPEC